MTKRNKTSAKTLTPFHVMAKPVGPICNLDCRYCFYLEKENLYEKKRDWAMPNPVLESYVSQFIAAQDVPTITFAWQGGEPTLLGVDFFRKVIAIQKTHANAKKIENTFQPMASCLTIAGASFWLRTISWSEFRLTALPDFMISIEWTKEALSLSTV